jgi:hypothetical protein
MEGRRVKKIQKTDRLSKLLFEEVEHLIGYCAKREPAIAGRVKDPAQP